MREEGQCYLIREPLGLSSLPSSLWLSSLILPFVPTNGDPNTVTAPPANIAQTEDQVTSEENSSDEALSISEEAPVRQDASEAENLPIEGMDSSDAIEPEIEETEGMPQ